MCSSMFIASRVELILELLQIFELVDTDKSDSIDKEEMRRFFLMTMGFQDEVLCCTSCTSCVSAYQPTCHYPAPLAQQTRNA
jgi:hypothetical protein